MSRLDSLPQHFAADRKAWRRWLERNHTSSLGVWLIFMKKSAGHERLDYNDAVEEALCFGWVDSLARAMDANRYMQLFTPRKPKSTWSAPNKERVARLIASGQMMPAGMEKIDIARRNGAWEVLDRIDALEIPSDLKKALRAHGATRTFSGFSPSARKGILYWITSAKRDETRAARVEKTARMAAKGLRAQMDPE